MKLPYPIKNGFTLIELMVVVAIIAIVSGITIPTFSKYTKNQSLKQAQELFKSELRSVQNKALVGTGSDSTTPNGQPVVAWGVYTAHGDDPLVEDFTKYRVFMSSFSPVSNAVTGCAEAVRQDGVEVYDLPTNVRFVAPPRCIIFRMEDGNVTSLLENQNMDVSLSGPGGAIKTINISHPGLIRDTN